MALIACLFLISCAKDDGPIEVGIETSASYTVKFTMNWNSTDFPEDYPSNARFSNLIGWSHKGNNNFFKLGTTASEGIQKMAETGETTTLQTELEAKITKGEGLDFIFGNELTNGTGEITVDVNVDVTNSAITLVSALMPSPDWYVGAINVNLYNGSNFIDSTTVTAVVYDSGSDSGLTFTADNIKTDPQLPISLLVDAPLGDGTNLLSSFATVSFIKK